MTETKRIVGKSFRLLDVITFDHKEENDSESTSGSSEDSNENAEFYIQMFGLNEKGETCSLIITDFNPFFFVKVGNNWTKQVADSLLADIKKKVGKYTAQSIKSIQLVDHNKLYGFSGGQKSRFVRITFANMAAFNKTKNLWYQYDNETNQRKSKPFIYNQVTLELYESNIPPLLRFFHIQNISPSGWVVINTSKCGIPPTKTTTCKYEYISSIKNVKPAPEKETRVPYKICSYDIEASSSHGDFPLPKKSYKRLATNLVDVFNTQAQIMGSNPLMKKKFLTKAILAAFGYDRLEDIDRIYTVDPTDKADIKSRIERLLETPVPTAPIDSNTIESIFERVSAEAEATGHVGNNDDDSDDDAAAAEADAEVVDEEEKPKQKKPAAKASGKPSAKAKQELYLHDLLSKDDETREQKIIKTNTLLTSQFPKVEGDKVTFIGSTFLTYGADAPYLNHCLVLDTCDPVEGAEIQSVKTERELILEWSQLIQRENPDIIIGYNIFGFDYEFMFQRAKENACDEEFLKLARRSGEVCGKRAKDGELLLDKTQIKIASGEYDLRYPAMTGRLQIDLYAYFRRDFNLSSYKLDDVAGQYISDEIKFTKIEDGKTFIYSKNLAGLHVGDFIHVKINSFSSDYFNGGQKFKVEGIETGVSHGSKKYNVICVAGEHVIPEPSGSIVSIDWGMAKDDVTPQDIFRLTRGSSADRAIVAKYCIQDCNLVHHLMGKLDIITGYTEMSSICSVPISFLVFRGQGIKLTSYVAKKCREKDTLMPDLEKMNGNEGYEGAIVLPPKCSMYIDNPVACVDYSSLYPSSMISQNYSHDSKVWTKEYDMEGNLKRTTGEKDKTGKFIYDNMPGYHYIDMEFKTYRYIRAHPKAIAKKTQTGTKVCRWAQLPNNQKSIMPSILTELLDARSATRKKAKTEPDPFMQNILDKRQLGYKVTANSLYGQCGAKTSTFYDMDVAASTTATGQMMITYAKRMIEEIYGDSVYETAKNGPVKCNAEYVYGDSVANYTPVTVRINQTKIQILTIEQLAELYGKDNWVQCEEPGKQTKEICELTGVESWTESGWTRLYRVIRHRLADHKKMIRVLTHTGLVDVTDDHSLVKTDGTEISPKECIIGTELLHNSLPTPIHDSASEITIEQAAVMGFFFGDGSCGNYDCPSGKKSSWALNNASINLLDKYLNLCKIAYPQFEWVVLDTIETSGVYKICPKTTTYGGIANFVREYRSKMYYKSAKIIPGEIMSASVEIRQAFWDGMYDADGDKDAKGFIRIDQKNQISASHIAWLGNSLGWKTSINSRFDKPNVYRITLTKLKQRRNINAIKKMNEIQYEGYVYDLTTENHHFAAGIGSLIVHNTDSVFFTFNLTNPETGEKIRGKPALEMTIEIAQEAAELCTAYLKPPMGLAYEKTLMPFILLSKKRYVGMLYEDDPNDGYLKFMGLVLKRRDNCDLVKDVYGGVLHHLMNGSNIKNAMDFLYQSLESLINGQVPMEKLMITKALRGDYKNPSAIAHRVLADRIAQRDPGNKPKPGDRMKYVYVVNKTAKLQGDKIETPEFIVERKLNIDYTHYITNQLMKPLQQLFGLAIEQIWELHHKGTAISAFKKDMAALTAETNGDIETFMKKREKYTSAKVKTILFDKFLEKIYNQQNGIRTMTEFMTPASGPSKGVKKVYSSK
jgi:DNA polymerase elongation subunit (family B)